MRTSTTEIRADAQAGVPDAAAASTTGHIAVTDALSQRLASRAPVVKACPCRFSRAMHGWGGGVLPSPQSLIDVFATVRATTASGMTVFVGPMLLLLLSLSQARAAGSNTRLL